MPRWTNWSGRQSSNPDVLHFARSPEDVQALLASTSGPFRVAGSGHSHYPLIPTDGTILDLSGLAGLISADSSSNRARFWAGSKIKTLGRPLAERGLGLHNQGDIDEQAIVGATSTGTHGTGETLGSFSAAVRATTLVQANGEVLTISDHENADLLPAAQLSLGALGVALDVTLDVRPAYRLAEQSWLAPLGEVIPQIDELAANHRHFEFFWSPLSDQAQIKLIDETAADPVYPVGAEGERTAWSYEVLPSYRPHRHTEMEFSVPREQGIACLEAIQRLLSDSFPDMFWPVEYRTLAADDVWLSPAFQRATATISVHHGVDTSDEPFFRACENVFRQFDGRPHWGKVHYFDQTDVAAAYPRFANWQAARSQLDPDDRFLNDRLATLLG